MLYRLYLKVIDYDVLANAYYFKPYQMETNEFSGLIYNVAKCDLLNFVEYLLYDLSKQTKGKKVSISFVDELIDVGASDNHLWDGCENIVFTLNKKKDKVSTHISSICWSKDKVRKLHFMDTDTLALMLNLLIGSDSSLISSYDKKTWESLFSDAEVTDENVSSLLDGIDISSMTDEEFLDYLDKNYLEDLDYFNDSDPEIEKIMDDIKKYMISDSKVEDLDDEDLDDEDLDDEDLDDEYFNSEISKTIDDFIDEQLDSDGVIEISDVSDNDETESMIEKESVCDDNVILITGPDDVQEENGENTSVGGQMAESIPVAYRKTNLKGLDLSGKLISFEGGEGSGKTSQINRLVWDLEQNGYDVLSLREPGGSRIAEEIREIILKKENRDMCTRCESLCFAAARAQLMEEVIEPALKEGKVVILDRYVDSSYVYQGLVKDAGLENIELINDFATNRRLTDLTIYIDVSPEEGFRRIEVNNRETNKFEEVDISFHEMVRDNYKILAKKHNNRIVELDGEKSKSTVYKSITNVLKSKFKPLN